MKTCRGAIRVDCHHNHPGLHLAVVLREDTGGVAVTEVAVAFLKASDYYRSERNTTATTDKFSFNGSRFASLLPPVEAAAG